ncbi:DUF2798 domain-containing protein [Colwellia sp. E2M01]|uniref:DUF2798 domain-containing protein n=1 Tax=Colwellia sp. E2M01 TaxID=2841561 RepID=UPI001C09F184|nr:DUF2798 domain-containing protein [Colwellia sp. E2M01]MBU2872177.1 DUF2798 domain-containing protein [Colwellia sp. E2M01]
MQIKLKNILVVLPIILTLIGTITGIMTYVNLTPAQDFISAWLKSFAFAFVVMLPLGVLILTAMSKLIDKFFGSLTSLQKRLLQGVLMAIVMESILAVVTTTVNHGYESHLQFINLVSTSFIYALPVGLAFSCLMTLILQPKLQQFLAR